MFNVVITPTALKSLKSLKANERTAVLDDIERILTVNPTLESKARVKKLRQPARAQFRLRVGDLRVFYDVDGSSVAVLNVVAKSDAGQYLEQES